MKQSDSSDGGRGGEKRDKLGEKRKIKLYEIGNKGRQRRLRGPTKHFF